MKFTVLTPSYNRGDLLWELFRSLQRQTFHDFEWVIVDDGSTDNTEQVVAQMRNTEHFFPIVYKKTPNGGKHRAWNRGLDLASGEMIFGCDSDDYLTDDALETVDRIEKTIPAEEKDHFAGVCGLRGYKNRLMVGNTFSGEYMDMTYLERIRNNVKGDKTEIFYTSVWKRYKYCEFEGERFLTEATSLLRMAEDGLKIRFFNNIVKITEYLPDGLTSNSRTLFDQNPRGWGLYIHQRVKYGLLRGQGKWDVILDYYDRCRGRLSIPQMAKYLHMPAVELASRVYGSKIRNRLRKLLRTIKTCDRIRHKGNK